MNTHKLAWAAGFFDGEGSTYLNHKKDRESPTLVLKVSQNADNVETLNRMAEALELGGVYGPYGEEKTARFCVYGLENVQAAVAKMWLWLGPAKRQQYREALSVVV